MTRFELKLRRYFKLKNDILRHMVCEFFCTMILIYCGTSVCAQTILSRGKKNEYVALAFGWGFSLLIAVQLGIRISGSHLNPAVSLFFLTIGRLSFVQFITYSIAQMLGGFIGAALTFIMYYDAINEFDEGNRMVTGPLATAGIFSTYPQVYLSVTGYIIDQLFATAFLVICVGTISDKRNFVPIWAQPFLLSLSLTLIGIAFSLNAGYAINPARDLSPRIATYLFGYGPRVFSYRSYMFIIPAVVPMIGAVVGGWIYIIFIGVNMPDTIEDANLRLPLSLRQNLPPLASGEESTATFSSDQHNRSSTLIGRGADSRML
ncbi:Major intrinsic protein domain containing protein [Aphelenchoides besseyi]|nr:Major intrinsic protein domain containing protein [Aphelenchoides besseyi]